MRASRVVPEERLRQAAVDLARFSISRTRTAYDNYLRQAGATRDDVLQLLALRSIDRSPASQPWQELLALVLSGDFLRACDRDIAGAEGLRKPLYPLLAWCSRRIDEWRAEHGNGVDWETLGPALLQRVSDDLFAHAYKTFVLEADIESLAGPPSRPRAAGDVVRSFADACVSRPRYVQRLFLRYAGLSRLLATTALQWQSNVDELLKNLRRDAGRIEAEFAPRGLAVLKRIDSTLSDPHDGGKRVQVLHFGDGLKIVYKPRPMEVDAGYSKLVQWLNARDAVPFLRTLKLVVGEGYGWVEFAQPEPLADERSAHAFYQRHGAHLALLYLTKSTDFHSENVIACGDQPILVDLETLMHADARVPTDRFPRSCGSDRLHESAFASGLLPGWATADVTAQSPDLSGIGAREGQFYREPSDFLGDGEDGGIAVKLQRAPVRENPNRPTRDGQTINPALYGADVLRGFEAAYRVLAAHATELAEPDGPLEALLRARTRHVALATASYGRLLGRASHPDFATRSLHRELILADLALRSDLVPAALPLLKSELNALFRGDVPRFSNTPGTTLLFDSGGAEFAGFLEDAATSEVRRRIADLNEENLAMQREVIRLAMVTLLRRGEPGTEPAPPYAIPAEPAQPGEILEAVREIAYAVCDSAIVSDGRIDWIAVLQGDYEQSRLSEVGPGLYDGAVGIGLFLAYAARQLDDARLFDAAALCSDTALDYLERAHGLVGGGYIGRCSIGYGLLHVATLLDQPEVVERVFVALQKFAESAAHDAFYDVIAGSAGNIGVLLAAHSLRPDPGLLNAAVAAAEHLLASRIECDGGYGWPPRAAKAPLTGFSHGAAGIGWALINLGQRAGRPDFIAAGTKAFDYERALYSPSQRGWPDLRDIANADPGAEPGCSFAWCHGGPGIGLSRATLDAARFGVVERDDVNKALETVLESPLAATDCLCHGELGNLELLVSAAPIAARPDLLETARRRATAALHRQRARGAWRCGAVPDAAVPGLLSGLSGIGYGLLRCYFPDTVPSVLSLAPPARRLAGVMGEYESGGSHGLQNR